MEGLRFCANAAVGGFGDQQAKSLKQSPDHSKITTNTIKTFHVEDFASNLNKSDLVRYGGVKYRVYSSRVAQ